MDDDFQRAEGKPLGPGWSEPLKAPVVYATPTTSPDSAINYVYGGGVLNFVNKGPGDPVFYAGGEAILKVKNSEKELRFEYDPERLDEAALVFLQRVEELLGRRAARFASASKWHRLEAYVQLDDGPELGVDPLRLTEALASVIPGLKYVDSPSITPV